MAPQDRGVLVQEHPIELIERVAGLMCPETTGEEYTVVSPWVSSTVDQRIAPVRAETATTRPSSADT